MKHFYSRGFPFHRGRRLRNNKNICDLVTETNLSVKDLVMPYFLREDNDETKISNMPGLKRFSIDELIIELEEIPLSYLPSGSVRIHAKAVGDIF